MEGAWPVGAPVSAQRAAWEGRAQWDPQADHPLVKRRQLSLEGSLRRMRVVLCA